MYSPENTPLGVSEIAKILKVKPDTVSSWQLRNNLPKPDWYINDMKTRIWTLKTVIDWANATGRNKYKLSYESAQNFLLGKKPKVEQATSNLINVDFIGNYDDSDL